MNRPFQPVYPLLIIIDILALNRHFVGIEKNESVALFKEKSIDYLDIAISRLKGILKSREVS